MSDFRVGHFTHLAISASDESKGLVNKLREIVDGKEMVINSDKDLLNISVGECVF